MENTKFDPDLIWQIKHLQKLLKNDFEERLAKFDLTCEQGRALFFIHYSTKDGKEVHQNDIQNRFHLSKSSVSGLISRMIKNELIEKTSSGQYSILSPTQKGIEITEYFRETRLKTINKLFNGFSSKEKDQITSNINKLINNMEKEDE